MVVTRGTIGNISGVSGLTDRPFSDSLARPRGHSGTRWGGGMWISSYDMARFGLLWLRGGKWGDRQIVSSVYVKMATTPSAHRPDYGLLWWLNTTGKRWPESPTTSFEARGQGGNIIHVDPAHDLLVVWRWSAQSAEGFKRIVESITNQ